MTTNVTIIKVNQTVSILTVPTHVQYSVEIIMSLIIIGFALWAITETYREWKKKHGYIPKYQ